MALPSLQAHFDGRQIVLDEPCHLPANTPVMVTPIPAPAEGDSETAWLKAASSSEAFEFLKNPAEDVYTLADGEPFQNAV